MFYISFKLSFSFLFSSLLFSSPTLTTFQNLRKGFLREVSPLFPSPSSPLSCFWSKIKIARESGILIEGDLRTFSSLESQLGDNTDQAVQINYALFKNNPPFIHTPFITSPLKVTGQVHVSCHKQNHLHIGSFAVWINYNYIILKLNKINEEYGCCFYFKSEKHLSFSTPNEMCYHKRHLCGHTIVWDIFNIFFTFYFMVVSIRFFG